MVCGKKGCFERYCSIKSLKTRIAKTLNLPIVIHTREAIMDTLDILKNVERPIKPGVFHCCPLNIELIKEALKLYNDTTDIIEATKPQIPAFFKAL